MRGRPGIPKSEEQKRKLSLALKGKPGKPKTEEHKRKLSIAMQGKPGYWTGKKMPESVRALMRGKRKPLSPGHRQKISESEKAFYRDHPAERAKRATWTGKYHTLATREKMSLAQKGENGSGWKGGVSSENECIRQSSEFKQWRIAVFRRDHFTCQKCGVKHQAGVRPKLHPHHIQPFAKYPELRFVLENGLTLCQSCHKEVHKNGNGNL